MTTFITKWDLHQWVRVSFGFTNAPAEIQRFVENTLFNKRDEFAFIYLDDTLVLSDTFDDCLNYLKKVFQRFRGKEIKTKAIKCKLFQRQVKYLGRVTSLDECHIDQENIKAVTDLLN